MKKTLNINLAGFPFIIDEDAYNLLKDYLDTIRYAFETNDDTEDLASDIESRIAEILFENENREGKIVTFDEISRVIERIGKPSDFIEVDENINLHESGDNPEVKIEEVVTPPPYEQPKPSRNPFIRKKIFRDPQNAMIGGVCSGLASYLGIDVTIVRLLTVLLFFLSATTVAIIYIILWIVVPEARTPLQRMQMKGEEPSVENIGRTLTENYQENENQVNSPASKGGFAGFVSTCLSVFVKFLIIIGLIVAVPLLLAFSIAFLACAIAVFVIGLGIVSGGMFDSVVEGLMVLYILLAVIGGAITIGIPLWLFIRMFWKKKNENPNPSNRPTLLLVWLVGIAMVAVFTVKSVRQYHKLDKIDWKERLENLNTIDLEEDENLEMVKIDEEGIRIKSKNKNMLIIDDKGIRIGSESSAKENSVVTDSLSGNVISLNDSVIISQSLNDSIK